jgi:branched-chain amino acid transport system substrate-binding protein
MGVSRRSLLGYVAAASAGFLAGRMLTQPVSENTVPQSTGTAKTETTSPVKVGVQTILRGPGAVLAEPLHKGVVLAAKEINEAGGLLGRSVEVVLREELGVDQTVREFRRLALADGATFYVGAVESVNTVALGPEAESLGLLSVFVDGGTEKLFSEVLPRPRLVFRTSNIDTVDSYVTVRGIAHWYPQTKRIAALYPDDLYGQLIAEVVSVALKKLMPDAETVYVGWPPPFTTDYSTHISSMLQKNPDMVIVALWGGDLINFYRQAMAYKLFNNTRLVSTYGFSIPPHHFSKDIPEGSVMGAHANYYFLYPPWDSYEINRKFNEKYFEMWKEYPGTHAELAYTSLMALKTAAQKAYNTTGDWPDRYEVAACMEGLGLQAPGGFIQYRAEDHQAVRNPPIGRTVNSDRWPFPIWDVGNVFVLPKEQAVPPPHTRMVDWVKTHK